MRTTARKWACRVAATVWLLAAPAIAADGPFSPAPASADRLGQLLHSGRTGQTDPDGLDDVLIVPERPGHNNVRYLGFDWRYFDFLDDRGVGGVRFYFYERERNVARIAAAIVREQYEMLARRFHYRPTTRIPYLLYNSHRELETTNVFFVNEYVLGVTSPQDLRMALPYWGEVARFREVSAHEMTHQFQIQKMRERAEAAGEESAIDKLPLWFTEGLAEYYSKNGIDLETDTFARDVMLNPRLERKYVLPDFWDDEQQTYVDTYKLGQLRVAFLADQYGESIIQTIIDQSPLLESPPDSGFGGPNDTSKTGFPEYVARLAGEKPSAIAERFKAWMKRRYFPEYLASEQEPPAIPPVEIEGEPDAFSSTEDGEIILYRTVERDSGRAKLFLADRRDKGSAVQVAGDHMPGIESLYPVLRRVQTVTGDKLAFLARRGAGDSLFVVPYTRVGGRRRHRLELGPRKVFDLSRNGLLEAGDPAFSPEGDRVAYYGLDESGYVDLWVTRVDTGETKRITDDLYSERDVAWSRDPPELYGVPILPGGGHDGTLIVACDETETGKYNLFAIDPATGARARLTDEDADHRAPLPLGQGRIVFATDARGKQDLHLYEAGTRRIRRLTDFVTGLGAPGVGPTGLTAVGLFGGQYRLFDVPTTQLLALDERPAEAGEPGSPRPLPRAELPPAPPAYSPYSLSNWRLQNAIAAFGTSAYGQGAIVFGDLMSDRNLILQLSYLGSIQLTDAEIMYVDRSTRHQWALGLFHTYEQKRDLNAPGFNPPGTTGTDVFYLQREFGATEVWSRPFDPFTRIEARLVQQGVQRSFMFPIDDDNSIPEAFSTVSLQTWDSSRAGYDFDTYASLEFGFDTTRYRVPAGAVGGGSFLIEAGAGTLPLHHPAQFYGYSYLDAEYHISVWRLGVLDLRLASGYSGGSVFGRQFFLSSYDNLRNYQAFDRRLVGATYFVTNANFLVPLDPIIRLVIFSNITGVLGMDFGSVAPVVSDLFPTRTLAGVLGVNLGFGPFALRLHFAKPIDTGNANNGMPYAWVSNVSLMYVYF